MASVQSTATLTGLGLSDASKQFAFQKFDGLKARNVFKNCNNDSISSLVSERRGPIQAVATPLNPPTTVPAKRSKVEFMKEESNFLRYPLIDELANSNPNVNATAEQLIKFHGSYMQHDRDFRVPGAGKAYRFMMRTRQPGGKVANKLYLKMDELADVYGNGSLRLTTRQTFQLHGVLKENLKTVFSSVIHNMGSTLGACGDLNRNILAPVVPYNTRPDYLYCQEYADKIAALLAPQAGAYYDVWVDGEKVFTAEEPEDVKIARSDNRFGTNFEGSPEPIYGTQYLPRKFKMALTVPGDNSVDLLTNDVGLVVMCNDDGVLEGFNIYVGGGMGRTHRNESTKPCIAQPLGFVPAADILYAVKAIVATQRDYGRRDDRRQARMKYLIEDWGIDKFRTVTEQYYGKKFQVFRELPPWKSPLYVGWGAQGDGRLYYGLHIENGRIKGEMKKALREVIEKYNLPVRISANQNLVLCDIRPSWKSRITTALAPVGILGAQYVDSLNLSAMACPALPLCALATTEAERGMPDVLKRIRSILDKLSMTKSRDTMVVRMTGCPNGCARPYMAELGFVGDGANSYQIWLGGTPNQTKLAEVFMDRVKLQDFEKILEPLFHMWKKQRFNGESFGEFTSRAGFEVLKKYIDQYEPKELGVSEFASSRITISTELMERVKAEAKERKISTRKLLTEVVSKYFEVQKES